LIVLSLDRDTSSVLSGEKAMALTQSTSALRVCCENGLT
jgi:hypothetical protein